MQKSENQVLTNLLQLYWGQYDTLREGHLDLNSLVFHKQYGLNINAPAHWNILEVVSSFLGAISQSVKVLVIYGATDSYKKINEVLANKVQYLSWHEIFTALHTSSTDVRYMQRMKHALSDADLVLFLDPPCIPEVVDQVYGQTANCLMVLSGGGI